MTNSVKFKVGDVVRLKKTISNLGGFELKEGLKVKIFKITTPEDFKEAGVNIDRTYYSVDNHYLSEPFMPIIAFEEWLEKIS